MKMPPVYKRDHVPRAREFCMHFLEMFRIKIFSIPHRRIFFVILKNQNKPKPSKTENSACQRTSVHVVP